MFVSVGGSWCRFPLVQHMFLLFGWQLVKEFDAGIGIHCSILGHLFFWYCQCDTLSSATPPDLPPVRGYPILEWPCNNEQSIALPWWEP